MDAKRSATTDVNKVLAFVEQRAMNELNLYFTDGSVMQIMAESVWVGDNVSLPQIEFNHHPPAYVADEDKSFWQEG
jgi:predicted metal-dependent peptidase